MPARKQTALAIVFGWYAALFGAGFLAADGPSDNIPQNVRPVPPAGIVVPDAVRRELTEAADALQSEIDRLRGSLAERPAMSKLLPDIEIFSKAVRDALEHNELFHEREFEVARRLLQTGMERAGQLAAGQAPWTTARGLVVRGYRSTIDDSVQPYGLIVPESYDEHGTHQHRLDAWFHGRGETLSELNFVDQRMQSLGEFTPPHAFVLHLYGRYCNANKFAGEIDLFEALADVQRQYRIDENRLVVRGFSMGGAACWQFATHYASRWAAAAPGAGFAETPDFLKVFQNEHVSPPAYEQQLWHWYDCTDWAANLSNCPTVAYSGEDDRQKQAADIMAKAMAAEGIELTHLIGPKTGHSYHPETKAEINRRIDAIVAVGRNPAPRRVRFTTWTTRYPNMFWVRVDGLETHWQRADVVAEIVDDATIHVATNNITALTLDMPSGLCPLAMTKRPKVVIDGAPLEAPGVKSDRSWAAHFAKRGDQWEVIAAPDRTTLRKRPGLQGPIDDAFMDSFLIVRPTGPAQNPQVAKWIEAELAHAIDHWRKQFRGRPRVKDDREITPADIAAHHLVLFGDPASNRVLAQVAERLPIKWRADAIDVGGQRFSASQHAPVMIYPNPMNADRYIVLNSGFTFREYDYLNNARQVAKLPDYAVFDIHAPTTSQSPGRVVTAGFFGENWELKP